MIVAELIAKLKKFDPRTPVYVGWEDEMSPLGFVDLQDDVEDVCWDKNTKPDFVQYIVLDALTGDSTSTPVAPAVTITAPTNFNDYYDELINRLSPNPGVQARQVIELQSNPYRNLLTIPIESYNTRISLDPET